MYIAASKIRKFEFLYILIYLCDELNIRGIMYSNNR